MCVKKLLRVHGRESASLWVRKVNKNKTIESTQFDCNNSNIELVLEYFF